MSNPADTFVRNAEGVVTARAVSRGELIHEYRGEVAAADGEVRLLTLAPPTDDEAVESRFRRVSGQWHNPSGHRTVVSVHDRGRQPRPWIAVDDPAGQPLDSVRRELSFPQMRAVVEDVAEALQTAALYNSSHLDLQPNNVYVEMDGEEARATVGDWGLERACRVAAGERYVTPFTAPEQIENSEIAGDTTDVHGLGALVYFMLTGEPAISGPTDLDTALLSGEVPPPSALEPDVPDTVDESVLTALAADPDERYERPSAFATEVIDALRSHFDATAGFGSATTGPAVPDSPGKDRNPAENASSSNENAKRRRAETLATRALQTPNLRERVSVGDVIEQLDSDDPDERVVAARALAGIARRTGGSRLDSNRSDLREYLFDDNERVRKNVAETLRWTFEQIHHPNEFGGGGDTAGEGGPGELVNGLVDEVLEADGSAFERSLERLAHTVTPGHTYRTEEVVPEVLTELEGGSGQARSDAVRLIAALASRRRLLVRNCAGELQRILSADGLSRDHLYAARALALVAEPPDDERMQSAIERLERGLDEPALTEPAVEQVAWVANARPQVLAPIVPSLKRVLVETEGDARAFASYALAEIAARNPEAAEPAVPALNDSLGNELSRTFFNSVRALDEIASDYDRAVSPRERSFFVLTPRAGGKSHFLAGLYLAAVDEQVESVPLRTSRDLFRMLAEDRGSRGGWLCTARGRGTREDIRFDVTPRAGQDPFRLQTYNYANEHLTRVGPYFGTDDRIEFLVDECDRGSARIADLIYQSDVLVPAVDLERYKLTYIEGEYDKMDLDMGNVLKVIKNRPEADVLPVATKTDELKAKFQRETGIVSPRADYESFRRFVHERLLDCEVYRSLLTESSRSMCYPVYFETDLNEAGNRVLRRRRGGVKLEPFGFDRVLDQLLQ